MTEMESGNSGEGWSMLQAGRVPRVLAVQRGGSWGSWLLRATYLREEECKFFFSKSLKYIYRPSTLVVSVCQMHSFICPSSETVHQD